MPKLYASGTRWLGVGLAAALCAVTVSLALTGRMGLYINPDSAWFAVGMAVVGLIGAAASFLLPLGAEADHGHDHGETHDHAGHSRVSIFAVIGGILASVVVIATLALPPASLSAQLATERDLGAAPLFGGDDVVQLATMGDTSTFGIGEWAAVFEKTPDPRALEGIEVTLTGFVAPAADGAVRLTRLVITHCVIDAQPAGVPVVAAASDFEAGQWVTVTGTIQERADGSLVIEPTDLIAIDEPADPYEY